MNTFSSETPPRGLCAFDHEALRRAIGALPPGAMLPDGALHQYREFYGLTFDVPGLQHELQVIEGAGARLAIQYFLPPGPSQYALLSHGYFDHVGLYGHVLRYLVSRGIAVAAYDQIGHGLSSGAQATIESFDRYSEACLAVCDAARAYFSLPSDHPWHWVGQSMGGAVVLETLHQQHRLEADKIILFAPLVRPHRWPYARIYFHIAKHLVDERPRNVTRNASNEEFMYLQNVDPLQARVLPVAWVRAMRAWYKRFVNYPVSELAPHIVQGEADKTIDWRYGLALLRQRYPAGEWCFLPEAGHHLVNESADLRARMSDWLDAQHGWQRNDDD